MLAVLLFGAWLWQGGLGLLPVERELVWKIPGDYGSIRRADLEIIGDGELLKHEELYTPRGLSLDPVQKLPLKAGTYEISARVWRGDAGEPSVHQRKVAISDEKTFVLTP